MDDKNKLDQETIAWAVSSQDLQNNPELAQAGVQNGEIIGIPVEDTNPPAEEGDALANGPESE